MLRCADPQWIRAPSPLRAIRCANRTEQHHIMSDSSLGADNPALMALIQFGWNDDVAAAFATVAEPGDVPARVIAVHRGRIVVATSTGERDATLDPRLLSGDSLGRPAAGDWIALRVDAGGTSARARGIVPRRSAFIRRAAGS